MGITWWSSVIATIIAVFEIVRVDGFGLASAPVHTTTTWSNPTNYACNPGEISRLSCLMAAKGFGNKVSTLTTTATGKRKKTASGSPGAGGGGNAPVTSATTSPSLGRSGSIQGDVMRKTEKAIRRTMDELRTSRPFVWEALELKRRLTMWQIQTTGLNILQAADLPVKQAQEMKAAEAKLRHLQETHNISDRLLHNIAQEATWDASARVKDERQESVELPPSAVEHMQAVVTRSEVDSKSRVMDVGAGTGILLRFLQSAGVQHENFFGVDLSSQMVQVAAKRYPKANFIQGDFLDYCDRDGAEAGFTHVFFNGCLHNFLEPGEALARAAELLKEGGKIVISHPKGAANVEKQRRANPTLVPNRLPTERDLERVCEVIPALASKDMRVVPESGQNKGKANEGYLQVLRSFTAQA